MWKIKQRALLALIFSITMTMSVGCAGRKKLVEENNSLKNEIARIDEESQIKKREWEKEKSQSNQEMQNLENKINQIREEKKFTPEDITLRKEDEKLIVSLSNQIVFEKGKYAIRDEMKPVLKVVSEYLRKYPERLILIQGHACTIPINNNLFPTNWELSARRATQILRYFTEDENLSAGQFAAIGYGEYHPRFSNATEEERSKNRRVEIAILSEKLTGQLM
ncbi:MAG: OmpA family protein [bacterium]